MTSHSSPLKDKTCLDVHVPDESSLHLLKQNMPGGKGLCSAMVSSLNSGQISVHTDHEKQHAPGENCFDVTSTSPFSCHQGSVGAPTCLDISDEADHGKAHTPKGGDLCLTPVSPSTCGQGLPYAPENWPCPGDIWTWRVGRRINRHGFFSDRCLCPPEHLQTPEIRKEGFRAKVSVEKYILTKFPEADLGDFFSSFSWSVRAKSLFRNKDTEKSENSDKGKPSDVSTHSNSRKRKFKSGKFSSCDSKSQLLVVSKKIKERSRGEPFGQAAGPIPRGKRLKRSRMTPMNTESKVQSYQSCSNEPPSRETPKIVILASFSEDSGSINQHKRTTANTENRQVSSHKICGNQTIFPTLCCQESVASKASVEDQNHNSSSKTRDIDLCINSLEEMLAKPVVPSALSVDTGKDLNLEKEIAEARAKLSNILAMDFSVFLSFEIQTDVANLLGILKKDPNLRTRQLVQIKLLETIPLLRARFLEEAKTIEEANNFFGDMSNETAKAYSLRDKYNDNKSEAAEVQKKIDTNSLHLQKIEEEICQLSLERDQVADTISGLMVQKDDVNLQKKNIVEVILPDIISSIEGANSKKMEWESKKVKALEHQAEINAVFVSLKDAQILKVEQTTLPL